VGLTTLTPLVNVRFNLVGTTYDSQMMRNNPDATIVSGLSGHLQLIGFDKESLSEGNRGKRASMFLLTFTPTQVQDALIVPGLYVVVTAELNVNTKGWNVLANAEQYVMEFIYPSYPGSREKVMKLARKDQAKVSTN